MTPEKLLGQHVGPYYLESILGSGGMAVVYRARNAQGQVVALKVLFPPPGAGPESLARFEREARTAARLNHPGIVRVLDVGQAAGHAFMAMPLVEGQPLAQRLAHSGVLAEATAADIAWQVADALYYAHSQGVVHRDVKPANILLTHEGRALLTDFGVAQALDEIALTHTGHTVGTPAYMAPEQAAGESLVDGRADLYSLGVVLYHMVTGRPPFQGTTPQVLHAHVYSAPPLPSTIGQVSRPMETIILKALAKDVSSRFQTGAAMAQALAHLDDQTQTGVEILPPELTRQPGPARRWLWLAFLLPLSLLAVWQLARFGPGQADHPTVTPTLTPALAAASVVALAPAATPSPAPTYTYSPTPAPTFTPTLSPSPTSLPTSTLPPPVTPTPPLPSPTPSPSATPCPQPVDPALSALIAASPVRDRLGCPRTGAITTAAAEQSFEHGLMVWRKDLNLIYGIESGGSWFFTGDTWRDGDSAYDPTIVAPDGFYQPVRGFGKVWRERPGARDSFGWATAEEKGMTAVIQEFTGGSVWQAAGDRNLVMLFNNGDYRIETP